MGAPLKGLQQLLGPSGQRTAHAGFLTEHDPRWGCHNIVEIVSAGADDDLLGIGSTPYVGDFSSTWLTVPATPSTAQQERYLFRLAAVQIPSGASIIIRGLRQAIGLIAPIPSATEGAADFPLYLEQESPFWRFTDGNVSWHLRHHTNIFRRITDGLEAPGTSPSLRGTGPARFYSSATGPGGFSLANGVPPGFDVQGLGTLRDIRYPWNRTDWSLGVPVGGPGIVALYCSVKQTNPATRLQTPFVTPNDSLRREDRFILETRQNTTEIVRYGRVAGAMLVEMFPCCKAPGEH